MIILHINCWLTLTDFCCCSHIVNITQPTICAYLAHGLPCVPGDVSAATSSHCHLL